MATKFKLNPITGNLDMVEVLTIQEIDGTPSATPHTLKVTNGTLTDNGDGSVTLTIAGGGGGSASDEELSIGYYRSLGT